MRRHYSAVPWILGLTPEDPTPKSNSETSRDYHRWVDRAIDVIEPPLWRPGAELEPPEPDVPSLRWNDDEPGRLLH